MLVSYKGVLVTGITSDEVAIDIDIISAGGVYVRICAEDTEGTRSQSSFFEFENGHYRIVLDPVRDDIMYKDGSYSGTVVVSVSEDDVIYNGSALMTWSIPPGLLDV